MGAQGMDQLVVDRFRLECPEADLTEWERVLYAESNPVGEVNIGMVGKYVELPDAYKSVNEALKHAGLKNRLTINIHYVDSQDVESKGTQILEKLDAILVRADLVSVVLKARLPLPVMHVKTKCLTLAFV